LANKKNQVGKAPGGKRFLSQAHREKDTRKKKTRGYTFYQKSGEENS